MENNKKLNKIMLKAEYSRYYPDPLNKISNGDPVHIEHHIILSKAIAVPDGISKAPNPREQRIDKGIYKDVRNSIDTHEQARGSS